MALDMAAIEDTVLRIIQKKTSPRWSQQYHSLEAIKEAILGGYLYRPRTKLWYVDQATGNDTTGDGGENKPYATIGKAESVAGAYDTIVVWGTFTENVTIDVAGIRLLGLGMGLSEVGGLANDTPIITLDANGFEMAGLILDGTAKTGHGLRIIDSDDLYIHHNTIRNITGAYDGIDKSSGINITDGRIENNTIKNCAGSGIGLIKFIQGRIIRNTIWGNGVHGIIIDADCDSNEILDNKVFDNLTGIEIQGDNNYLLENIIEGHIAGDMVNTGSNNRWLYNHFKKVTASTHTTTGMVEETVFTDTCVQPNTRIKGYLRLDTMVALDDFIFRTKKSYNAGVTWDIIDETNLQGAQTIDHYPFGVTLEDASEQVRVTIERLSAVDRAFYHKRIKKDS